MKNGGVSRSSDRIHSWLAAPALPVSPPPRRRRHKPPRRYQLRVGFRLARLAASSLLVPPRGAPSCVEPLPVRRPSLRKRTPIPGRYQSNTRAIFAIPAQSHKDQWYFSHIASELRGYRLVLKTHLGIALVSPWYWGSFQECFPKRNRPTRVCTTICGSSTAVGIRDAFALVVGAGTVSCRLSPDCHGTLFPSSQLGSQPVGNTLHNSPTWLPSTHGQRTIVSRGQDPPASPPAPSAPGRRRAHRSPFQRTASGARGAQEGQLGGSSVASRLRAAIHRGMYALQQPTTRSCAAGAPHARRRLPACQAIRTIPPAGVPRRAAASAGLGSGCSATERTVTLGDVEAASARTRTPTPRRSRAKRAAAPGHTPGATKLRTLLVGMQRAVVTAAAATGPEVRPATTKTYTCTT
eukprot:363815-Chlamydomonas_euryale.AAC.5